MRDEQRRRASQQQLALPQVAPPKIHGEVKYVIKDLRIEGATLLTPRVRAEVEHDFTGRAIGVDDIEKLFSRLMRYYFEHGYATTRVYLPDQDLSTGVLRVAVLEGHIEGFVLKEPGRPDRTPPANLIPASVGGILNLRDLERGVDNLNRLSSDQATLDLIPGSQPGGTVVGIKNMRSRMWHLDGSLDNTGSADTGRVQSSLTLQLDNVSGFYDGMMLNYRRSLPYNIRESGSESFASSVSVPLGYYIATVGGNYSDYALTFHAPSGASLLFDGNNKSAYAKLERLIFQHIDARLSASATLTWKSSANFLLHGKIPSSSRELVVLDLAANYGRPLAGGALTVSPGLSFGVPMFGSLKDPSNLPSYAPRAKFVKSTLTVAYMRGFKFGGQNWSFSSSLNGQYAMDVLYGSEQETISGLYAVRGFDRTTLAADHGYVWRNDLSLNLNYPAPFAGKLGSVLGIRPFVGLDQGCGWSRITDLGDGNPVTGSVAGATAGIGFSLGAIQGDVSYSRQLDRPARMARDPGRVIGRFSASY